MLVYSTNSKDLQIELKQIENSQMLSRYMIVITTSITKAIRDNLMIALLG